MQKENSKIGHKRLDILNRKRIDIVTHCYAEKYSCYAAFLNYQLSSVVNYPTKCKVLFTICCTLDDKATQKVIRFFSELGKPNIRLITLGKSELGRRAIGRNIAAKTTEADIIWFTDVDHCFCNTCLDDLVEMEWPDDVTMMYPRRIKIQKSHVLGDISANKIAGKIKVVDIDKQEFGRRTYNKAIGGIQIVRGDFAREHGYLDGFKKFMRPVKIPFKNFRDDVSYRIFCEKRGRCPHIQLSGVYRLRHTVSATHKE